MPPPFCWLCPSSPEKPSRRSILTALAEQLGSDVPFFLHGGTALGLGRGEELYPLPDCPAARGCSWFRASIHPPPKPTGLCLRG